MHLTAAADDHRAVALPPRMRVIIHHRRTCDKYAMTGLNRHEYTNDLCSGTELEVW